MEKFGIALMILLLLNSCGGRRIIPVSDEKERAESLPVEDLLQRLESTLSSVEGQKDALEKEKKAQVDLIQTLADQIASNQKMSEELKADLQKQMETEMAAKAATEKKLAELEVEKEKIDQALKDLQEQLNQLKQGGAAASKLRFVAAANLVYCVGVQGNSMTSGAPFEAAACNAAYPGQQLVAESRGASWYFKARHSNMCMSTSNTFVGSVLVQKPCTYTQDQAFQWMEIQASTGRLRNVAGLCVAYNQAQRMVVHTCVPYGQRFSFTPVTH